MKLIDSQSAERIRALATSLDCVTSEDFRALAGITESTEEAWAKRHSGPAYIILGNSRLYPREDLKVHLGRLKRERNAPLKGAL